MSSEANGDGRQPRMVLPPRSCECHSHIYEPGYPTYQGRMYQRPAPLAQYRRMLARLGFERAVIVGAAIYGPDNSSTLDAVRALGRERARGIAVALPDVCPEQLRKLDAGGIVGLRISFGGSEVSIADLPELARKIAPFGWHLQLPMWLPDSADMLASLPVEIVFDHLGRTPAEAGSHGTVFKSLLRFLERGKGWLKISAPYYSSLEGPPAYGDFGRRVKALAAVCPERLIWGANWPHPAPPSGPLPWGDPEEADWLDGLLEWVPDEEARNAILADNPSQLYRFAT
jgi:D-galactarolactone isomerase